MAATPANTTKARRALLVMAEPALVVWMAGLDAFAEVALCTAAVAFFTLLDAVQKILGTISWRFACGKNSPATELPYACFEEAEAALEEAEAAAEETEEAEDDAFEADEDALAVDLEAEVTELDTL
jgi:hypothetical protein